MVDGDKIHDAVLIEVAPGQVVGLGACVEAEFAHCEVEGAVFLGGVAKEDDHVGFVMDGGENVDEAVVVGVGEGDGRDVAARGVAAIQFESAVRGAQVHGDVFTVGRCQHQVGEAVVVEIGAYQGAWGEGDVLRRLGGEAAEAVAVENGDGVIGEIGHGQIQQGVFVEMTGHGGVGGDAGGQRGGVKAVAVVADVNGDGGIVAVDGDDVVGAVAIEVGHGQPGRVVARGQGEGIGEFARAVVEQDGEVVGVPVGDDQIEVAVGVAVEITVGDSVGGLADGDDRRGGRVERAALVEHDGDLVTVAQDHDQVGAVLGVEIGHGDIVGAAVQRVRGLDAEVQRAVSGDAEYRADAADGQFGGGGGQVVAGAEQSHRYAVIVADVAGLVGVRSAVNGVFAAGD